MAPRRPQGPARHKATARRPWSQQPPRDRGAGPPSASGCHGLLTNVKVQDAVAAARALERAAEKATERQQPLGPHGERIRASHWRYCHAKLELVEQGKGPTVVALAKALGINRVTLYKFLWRYPWVDGWVNGIARDAAVQRHGLVLLRHYNLAIQGSVPSADLVCKMEGGYYARTGGGGFGDDADPNGGRVIVNNTFLVPRPDYAAAAAKPALPAASVPAIPASVPRV